MDKQMVVFLCSKKERKSDTHSNMDELQKYVKQKIQMQKTHTYYSIYIEYKNRQ